MYQRDLEDAPPSIAAPRLFSADMCQQQMPRCMYSLRVFMETQPLDRLQLFLEVNASITEALEFLHARGLTHNDIKTDNVLRRPDGQWALCDMDLVQPRLCGSLLHASPTHPLPFLLDIGAMTFGAHPRFRFQCDLWAFGCLLRSVLDPVCGAGFGMRACGTEHSVVVTIFDLVKEFGISALEKYVSHLDAECKTTRFSKAWDAYRQTVREALSQTHADELGRLLCAIAPMSMSVSPELSAELKTTLFDFYNPRFLRHALPSDSGHSSKRATPQLQQQQQQKRVKPLHNLLAAWKQLDLDRADVIGRIRKIGSNNQKAGGWYTWHTSLSALAIQIVDRYVCTPFVMKSVHPDTYDLAQLACAVAACIVSDQLVQFTEFPTFEEFEKLAGDSLQIVRRMLLCSGQILYSASAPEIDNPQLVEQLTTDPLAIPDYTSPCGRCCCHPTQQHTLDDEDDDEA